MQGLRASGYTQLDDKTPIDTSIPDANVLFSIRRRLLQNKSADGTSLKPDQRIYSVSIVNGVGAITFNDKDELKAKEFLKILLEQVNFSVSQYIKPLAKSKIEAYESLLLIKEPSEVVGLTIVQGYESYSRIKAYLDDGSMPISLLRQPYSYRAELAIRNFRSSVLKKGIILVFGVFFMAVFAAFVLQYVDNVRKDPESMAKLRDAMHKK